MALEWRLRLLILHLAGRAILARTEPEDLLQEVFLRAMTAPEGLPVRKSNDATDSALYALLAQIARNVVVDIARSIRALKRDGSTTPLVRADWSRVQGVRNSEIASLKPGPASFAAALDQQNLLIQRFRLLDSDHRRVIGFRQFEGKSASETAQRMGRSETAIHSLYRRALEAWEQALPQKE